MHLKITIAFHLEMLDSLFIRVVPLEQSCRELARLRTSHCYLAIWSLHLSSSLSFIPVWNLISLAPELGVFEWVIGRLAWEYPIFWRVTAQCMVCMHAINERTSHGVIWTLYPTTHVLQLEPPHWGIDVDINRTRSTVQRYDVIVETFQLNTSIHQVHHHLERSTEIRVHCDIVKCGILGHV